MRFWSSRASAESCRRHGAGPAAGRTGSRRVCVAPPWRAARHRSLVNCCLRIRPLPGGRSADPRGLDEPGPRPYRDARAATAWMGLGVAQALRLLRHARIGQAHLGRGFACRVVLTAGARPLRRRPPSAAAPAPRAFVVGVQCQRIAGGLQCRTLSSAAKCHAPMATQAAGPAAG